MSAPPALELAPLERLTGWGRSCSALCHVYRPSTADGVHRVLELARRLGMPVGLRGAGQSYGDAALTSGGVVLDLSRMARVLDWDPERGIARVEPGVTVQRLWQYAIEDGWWPAVVPGTSFATLGGCAAMNVHGKNAWRVGPIGEHIESFDILLPSGELRTCSRERDAELFHAAIGGFGMLGCILSLTVHLERIHSGLLDVEPLAAANLDEMLELLRTRLDRADYLVGWVDCLARGTSLGRGLVHAGRYLEPGADPQARLTLRREHQEAPDTLFHLIPKSELWRAMRPLFNRPGMTAVNLAKYALGRREHGRGYRQPHAQFAFLLDYLPDWKLAYGPRGMIQYQSFVPEARAAEVFRAQLELASAHRFAPLLGVLKRHRPDPFLVSHGVDGYSLALELAIPRGRRAELWELAREMDALIIAAGGRFYLAKDATLTRASFASHLGEERVQRFLAHKRRLDPDGLLQSDLYRRLFLPAS